MEALNCAFMFVATLNMFLLPAVTYAANYVSPCSDWCVIFALKSILDIYHGVINIHVGLRGYVAFYYMFRISGLNIFLLLVRSNSRSM